VKAKTEQTNTGLCRLWAAPVEAGLRAAVPAQVSG